MVQVSAERDSSNQANVALKAELDRYRDVTGNTVEALEREKAVKAKLETQNKAQVCAVRYHPSDSCMKFQLDGNTKRAIVKHQVAALQQELCFELTMCFVCKNQQQCRSIWRG